MKNTLKACDQWMSANLHSLHFPLSERPSPSLLYKIKALAELSLYTTTISLAAPPRWHDALQSFTDNSEFLKWLIHFTRHNIDHANLPAVLIISHRHANWTNAQKRDIQVLTELIGSSTKELLPFRKLETVYQLHMLTQEQAYLDEVLAIGKKGCLGRLRNRLQVSVSDAYSVTHTVFYVTDFGRRPWPESLCDLAVLDQVLNRLSLVAQKNNNLDLLAEYALCRIYLGIKGPALDDEVDLIQQGQHSCGYWPGPKIKKRQSESGGVAQEDLEFFDNYHTTVLCREVVISANLSAPLRKALRLVERKTEYGGSDGWSYIDESHLTDHRLMEMCKCLRRVVSGEPIVELPSFDRMELLHDPELCAQVAELLYWSRILGRKVSPKEFPLEVVLDLDPLDLLHSGTFLFTWVMSHLAFDRKLPSSANQLFVELQSRFAWPHQIPIDENGLKALAAGCLLSTHVRDAAQNSSPFIQTIENLLEASAATNDLVSFTALAPYFPARIADHWIEWIESMWADSLGFGWLIPNDSNGRHFNSIQYCAFVLLARLRNDEIINLEAARNMRVS